MSEEIRKWLAPLYRLENYELLFDPASGFGEGRNPIFVIWIVLLLEEGMLEGVGGRATRA